ncbi:hypothetical protein [Couchioplanes caeruleus]|uniref:Uncharacterized protein n=2 Tax=Couchioplanes caeruleus TaxID=56438 RepID=A0A1K0FWW4_9ACTN|nr:hypothetical protein [Couchioplanes caeruleus]OJF09570.1 hypothetical protein BG844_36790 [Couchioplanes caeruleus subsp. caeruleus]ROP32346.1 hypothetical protein EDD30_5284 [Couchioplanes caeruleus]
MPAIAVPAFALTWWLGCYLVARDPARVVLWRAGGALGVYAVAVAAWSVAPGSAVAEVLLCVPALCWSGTATALLPRGVPERRLVNVGWAYASVLFLILAVVLPGVGKLVALTPLAGATTLLLRNRDRFRPHPLPVALSATALLHAVGLTVLLAPGDLGPPEPLIAAIGLDLLLFGFLVAIADAAEAGERLVPDLRRSFVAAVAATLLCAGPATLTMLAAPRAAAVIVPQFVLVAVALGAVGLAAPVRAALDRVAFLHQDRLRLDRAALLMAAEALPRRHERHRLIALDEQEFRRLTRRALEDFGDTARLMRSPLVELPMLERRLRERGPGLAEQSLVRAAELRAVLAEQVRKLKPAAGFGITEEWWRYNALHYCRVLGLRPYDRSPPTDNLDGDALRALEWFRYHVPRERLNRWAAEGADMIAARLWRDLLSTDPRWLTRAATGAYVARIDPSNTTRRPKGRRNPQSS